jgi:nucleoside-diphosphate-sugar epimerase
MTQRTYIVTGGGGFVGSSLCHSLLAEGHRVISISRGNYPKLLEAGVECVRADLGEKIGDWDRHFAGVNGVFHTAAKVDMWGYRKDFVKANVHATENVISACRKHGVKQLVFTSSPSVVHTGQDLLGVDESTPLSPHFSAFYPETKAIAEKLALAASDGELHVVALRPHLIWGPNDTNLIPAITERALKGSLKQVGEGKNIVDLTFIEDCVQAHLCAMKTLEQSPEKCSGKAYFISQGDPVLLWDWINQVLIAHNLPPVTRSVPLKIAIKVAKVCELFSRMFLACGILVPPRFSTFLVSEMATSHYFNISAAKKDLGFQPRYSIAEAMIKTFGSRTASIH